MERLVKGNRDVIRSDYLFDVDIEYDREKLLSEAKSYPSSLWNYYTYIIIGDDYKKINFDETSNIDQSEIHLSTMLLQSVNVCHHDYKDESYKVKLQFEDIFDMTDKDYDIMLIKFNRPINWAHCDLSIPLNIPLSYDSHSLRFYENDKEVDYSYKCALLNSAKKRHSGNSLKPDRFNLRFLIKFKTYEECKRIYFSS